MQTTRKRQRARDRAGTRGARPPAPFSAEARARDFADFDRGFARWRRAMARGLGWAAGAAGAALVLWFALA